MDILKLTENIAAIKMDVQKEVLVLQTPRPLNEFEAQALRDFKNKTGIRILALDASIKINVIDTSAGHNHG